MNLFIVNKYNSDETIEFQGVFSTEQKAIDACIADNYCVCPCLLDERLSDDATTWTGAYYPRLQEKP